MCQEWQDSSSCIKYSPCARNNSWRWRTRFLVFCWSNMSSILLNRQWRTFIFQMRSSYVTTRSNAFLCQLQWLPQSLLSQFSFISSYAGWLSYCWGMNLFSLTTWNDPWLIGLECTYAVSLGSVYYMNELWSRTLLLNMNYTSINFSYSSSGLRVNCIFEIALYISSGCRGHKVSNANYSQRTLETCSQQVTQFHKCIPEG